MAEVQIKNLRKTYGAVVVIPDISLYVKNGEFVALVGPSGCGKSTLLRMIAGLESISSGDVTIGGERVNDKQPKDRDIAMVFQNYALYPNKTVAANMGFPLKMSGVPKPEISAKVDEIGKILGLSDLMNRYPKQLSGGQRQRVAMGRAIVRNPQVFLFDEPLSNLDAKLRVKMRAEIKELHQKLKTTTIYVTHDQVEAMTMADKIVVLRAGVVEQFGAPLDLYDRPANKFVASFIGSPSMNFLEGQVETSGNRVYFQSERGIKIALDSSRKSLNGQKLTLGIRPEHIEILSEEFTDAIPMKVSVIEPTGNEATFVLRTGEEELVVFKHGRHDIAQGTHIWVKPDPQHIHFFDADENAI